MTRLFILISLLVLALCGSAEAMLLNIGTFRNPPAILATEFSSPSGFLTQWDYTAEFSITENADGSFSTSYDPDDDKPDGLTSCYIDPVIDGSGDTGTEAAPYDTFAQAVSGSCAHFIAKGAVYDRTSGFAASYAPTASIIVESWDGNLVYLTRALAAPVWAQESAPNDDVWCTTLPASADPAAVIDFTYAHNGTNVHADSIVYAEEFLPDGETRVPIPFNSAADIAAAQANPGSWTRSTTTICIHTHDSREPDTSVKVLTSENVTNLATGNAITVWFSNVVLMGNNAFAWNAPDENTGRVVAVDSAAGFAGAADDSWDIDDIDTRFVRVQALDTASADGFSYHRNVAATRKNNHLEVDCYSARNGWVDGGINDNGSTTHDLVNIIRLNGLYKANYGPNVADTAGSWALNLGITTMDSNGTTTADVGIQSGTYSTIYPAMSFIKNATSQGGDAISLSKATGGQLIDLGGGSYENGVASGSYILDGTNPYYLAVATVAPDALIGWWDLQNTAWLDIQSGGVDDIFDISPNKANLADGGTRATYNATNALANGFAAMNPGTANNSIYYLASKSTVIREVVMVGAVEDGADTTFDASMRFMSNATGVKRLAGSSGTATLEDAAGDSAGTTVSIDGAAASATMLPTGYSLWRFTLGSDQTDTFRFFGDSSAANVGIQGIISDAFIFNRTLSSDEWNALMGAITDARSL
jgi:hypothetical protein